MRSAVAVSPRDFVDHPSPDRWFRVVFALSVLAIPVYAVIEIVPALLAGDFGRGLPGLLIAGLFACSAVLFWKIFTSFEYRLSRDVLVISSWFWTHDIRLRDIRSIRPHGGPGTTVRLVGRYGNRLAGGLLVDAGPFPDYWITPTDFSDFTTRVGEAKASLGTGERG